MTKDGLPETDEERLAFKKEVFEYEEKKLKRYYKLIKTYTDKAQHQIKYCNVINADINAIKARINSNHKIKTK